MASHYVTENLASKGFLGKERGYAEVLEFLAGLKPIEHNEFVVQRMHDLSTFFGAHSFGQDLILIGGCNGKSIAVQCAAKLLAHEGYSVGCGYSSHVLTYNERFVLDGRPITNKDFTAIANDVINAVIQRKIDATAFEILTMVGLLYFKREGVDIVVLEVGIGGKFDATNAFNTSIAALTRVAQDHNDILGDELDGVMESMLGIAKKDTIFISTEQSKLRLQKMKVLADKQGSKWMMPIRKLSALPDIFEQLFGRSASLAERVALLYVEQVRHKVSPFLQGNLLATVFGGRGRPTREARRSVESNPVKTLRSFWDDEFTLPRGCFELISTEKPTVLLDRAHNIDALENVFLGVRLLHYQRPLKGFSLIVGLRDFIDAQYVLKKIRYLFKRVGGIAYFVPLAGCGPCHTPQDLAARAKSMSLKARSTKTFAEAFEAAQKNADQREGLVAVCGSPYLVSEYWNYKGIKKLM